MAAHRREPLAGERTNVRFVLPCQRWLAPFSAQSNGGIDNDIGLHVSQALALTPTMNLFNLRVRELQAGLAPIGRFWNIADIGACPRLIVSRLYGQTESAQASS